ncbi:MAG: shikimate kinase, partial [Flavobacteriaceae bacterium]
MGSGKSTLGPLLADSLGLSFIDLDHYIETQIGLSIPEIFEQKGAVFFRKQ